MKKHTLILLLLFSSFTVFGQKIKTDTTFYQGEEVVNEEVGYTTYEVCEVDRKGRRIGDCNRYSKSGKLVEFSKYENDERNGTYIRYSPLEFALIQGKYAKGQKEGSWVTFDMEGNLNGLEIYKKDNLIESRTLDVKQPPGPDNEGVTVVYEKLPNFPGGMSAWNSFLSQNLQYPRAAKEQGLQGEVFIQFIVTKEGFVIAPAIVRSPGLPLSKEAIRVMQLSPNWNPATANGEAIDGVMKMRLTFKMK